jgi:phosphonate transport system substrate-binding protein
MKKINFFIILMLTFTFTASCTDRKKSATPDSFQNSVHTGSFVIALIPAQNVFKQKQRYQPLADYLSRSLQMNVKTKILDSYDAIYKEMLENRVDAAFFGSLGYVVMGSRIEIEPIARPVKEDGTSTYRGLIFTLKDKGITGDFRTWRNKRIALVHKSTTAGYIFPKYYLHKKGVTEFESYFRKIIYAGSHDAVVLSVLTGDADIGSASSLIVDRLIAENPLISDQLLILVSSAEVPASVLGVRKNTDADLKERLTKALMTMENTAEGKAILSQMEIQRYTETRESEFETVLDMLGTLDIRPETFTLDAIGRGLSWHEGNKQRK